MYNTLSLLIQKDVFKIAHFLRRIYSEIISLVILYSVSEGNFYSATSKITNITAKALFPIYKIVIRGEYNHLFRGLFADIATSLNRRKRLALEIKYVNLDILLQQSKLHEPVIFCTTHIRGVPYALAQILDQLNYHTYLVSFVYQREGWNWGSNSSSDVLMARDDLFLKLRRVLSGKTAVIVLVDHHYTTASKEGLISPNIFFFASKFKCKVLFFSSIIQEDSTITISFGQNMNCNKDGYTIAEDFSQWIHAISGWRYKIQKPKETKID